MVLCALALIGGGTGLSSTKGCVRVMIERHREVSGLDRYQESQWELGFP